MKKILFLLICTFALNLWAQKIDVAFRGDYADPTIVRVNNDFYMTHTSHAYYPGLLIWHSKDLKHWTPVSRALYQNIGTVWAPEFIHYQNKFYIYFPTDKGGNYVITADRPEGPWSDPVKLNVNGIDPGHIADAGGNRYLHVNMGRMVKLSSDGLKAMTKEEKVYDGWQYPSDWVVECFCLESPKLFFHNGFYYMVSAEGGTSGPSTSHMAVVARSKSCAGPWENSPHNPLIRTYFPKEEWVSKGHGTIFEDSRGKWHVVYHAYDPLNRHLGRSTLIEDIEWTEDGWPLVKSRNDASRIRYEYSDNTLLESDDFSSDKLKWQWSFWGLNSMEDYKLCHRSLEFRAVPDKMRALAAVAPCSNYEVSFKISTEGKVSTGLVLFYDDKCYVGLGISDGKIYGLSQGKKTWAEIPLEDNCYFKLRLEKASLGLYYSRDGTEWKTYPHGFDVSGYHTNMLLGFLSLRPAVLCQGEGKVFVSDFTFKQMDR